MKNLKVRYTKSVVALVGFCFIFLLIPFIFIVYHLAGKAFAAIDVITLCVLVFFALCGIVIIYFLIYFITYSIRVEYNYIIVRRVFSEKKYNLKEIEYALTSAMQNRQYGLTRNINKNKNSYVLYFDHGKVRFNDNMENSAELLKIVSKYCFIKR